MMLWLERAASYGPKQTSVLSEPVEKHGAEVADSSVMTSAEESTITFAIRSPSPA